MSIKSQWIGTEGAAFERVGLAFESLGYRRPRPDDSTDGAYASNIADQYRANLNQREALAIVRYGLMTSRDAINARWMSEREIVERYAE